MIGWLLAGCAPPPGGSLTSCNDNVGPSILRPFGVLVLALGIVVVVVGVARRGELPSRRFVPLAGLIAVAAIVFASWLGTHQFLARGGECTALGSGTSGRASGVETDGQRACLRYSRTLFGLGVTGAATSLIALWLVAREPSVEAPPVRVPGPAG